MLMSSNILNLTAFQLETYSNTEVIAVGQDMLGVAGRRLVGGPLSSGGGGNVPLTATACTGSAAQKWAWNVTAPGYLSVAGSGGLCANTDDCGYDIIMFDCITTGGTCCGTGCFDNLKWFLPGDGTLRSTEYPTMCVTSQGVGSQVSLTACSAGIEAQQWVWSPAAQTLSQRSGSMCLDGSGSSRWGGVVCAEGEGGGRGGGGLGSVFQAQAPHPMTHTHTHIRTQRPRTTTTSPSHCCSLLASSPQ